MKWYQDWVFFGALIILIVYCFIWPSEKANHDATPRFTEENIIRAILGESRSEGDDAMYAHACAIRNRKTLKGVYGATARMEEIPPALWQRASRAWHTSEYEGDVTLGSTHWLSTYDKKHCRSWRHWISDYQAMAVVGKTTFYKLKGATK